MARFSGRQDGNIGPFAHPFLIHLWPHTGGIPHTYGGFMRQSTSPSTPVIYHPNDGPPYPVQLESDDGLPWIGAYVHRETMDLVRAKKLSAMGAILCGTLECLRTAGSDLTMTDKELANLLGVSPSTVARLLKECREAGLVTVVGYGTTTAGGVVRYIRTPQMGCRFPTGGR